MKRIKPWLLLVLVFVAGFAGGMVSARIAVRHFVQKVVKDPDFMRDRIERRMAAHLRLDPQQRTKVHEVLLNTQDELKNLRREFQPRFTSVMDHAQSEISAVLTPEQRARFDRFREENRVWLHPR